LTPAEDTGKRTPVRSFIRKTVEVIKGDDPTKPDTYKIDPETLAAIFGLTDQQDDGATEHRTETVQHFTTTAGKMFGVGGGVAPTVRRGCDLGDDLDALAAESFIPVALLRRWVEGTAHPTPEQREAVAAVLGVEVDTAFPIIGDTPAKQPVKRDRQTPLGKLGEASPRPQTTRAEMAAHLEEVAAARDAGNEAEVRRLEKAAELIILRDRVEAL
jgi:hypothetical protein